MLSGYEVVWRYDALAIPQTLGRYEDRDAAIAAARSEVGIGIVEVACGDIVVWRQA